MSVELQKLHGVLDEYRESLAVLLAATAPLKARRAAILATIEPLEAELREINKSVKAAEQPRLGELMNAISGIENTLGIKGLRECCADEANLELSETRENISVRTCKVCARKHYTMIADPVKISVEGAPLAAA